MAAVDLRRDIAGLLVGRADALYVLRTERRHDVVSQQVRRSRLRGARGAGNDVSRLRYPGRRQHPRPEILQYPLAKAGESEAEDQAVLRNQIELEEGSGSAA